MSYFLRRELAIKNVFFIRIKNKFIELEANWATRTWRARAQKENSSGATLLFSLLSSLPFFRLPSSHLSLSQKKKNQDSDESTRASIRRTHKWRGRRQQQQLQESKFMEKLAEEPLLSTLQQEIWSEDPLKRSGLSSFSYLTPCRPTQHPRKSWSFFFLKFSRENPSFLVRKSSFFLIWVVALLVGFVVGGVHNTAFHGGDRLPETGGQGEECVRHGKSEDGDGGRARVERLINRRWTHRSFAKGLLCDVADGSW